jgi:hypothetical protein
MFRPLAAIIRFSFECVLVALIGLVWLYRYGEISTPLMFAIVKGHGGEGICDVRYPGCSSSMSARCCLM